MVSKTNSCHGDTLWGTSCLGCSVSKCNIHPQLERTAKNKQMSLVCHTLYRLSATLCVHKVHTCKVVLIESISYCLFEL